MKMSALLFCLAALVVACSPNDSGTPKIAGDQREALNKAKTIDATVQDSAEAQKRQMEEQAE